MEIVIKASAIAAVSAICILLIKKNNGEIGLAVAIAAAAVICFAAAQLFGNCYNRKDRLRSVQGCRAKRHRLVA